MTIFQSTLGRDIKAALCDLDGTLIDSEHWLNLAWIKVLALRGCDYNAFDKSKIMGLQGREACVVLINHFGFDADPDDFVLEWRKAARKSVYANAKLCLGVEGTLDIFEKLNLKKAIVTTSGEEYVKTLTDKLGLTDRFSLRVTRDTMITLGKKTKPAPDPYLYAAEQLGEDPGNCLVLEDSAFGVLSGKAAGCYVIAVSHHDEEIGKSLVEAGADQVVGTLEEFREHTSWALTEAFQP